MSIHKRLQINVELQRVPRVTALRDVRGGAVFPMVWIDEGAELDDENEKIFKDMFATPILIVQVLVYGGCYVLGAVLLGLGAGMDCWLRGRRRRVYKGLQEEGTVGKEGHEMKPL